MAFFRQHPSGAAGFSQAADPFAGLSGGAEQDNEEIIDFEDAYDDFNDDTFGGGTSTEAAGDGKPVGTNFDFFGRTAKVADAIEEEQIRFQRQQPNLREPPRQDPARKPVKTGYEKYTSPDYVEDLQVDPTLWGQAASQPATQISAPAGFQDSSSRRMMTLDEIEEAAASQSQPSQAAPPSLSQSQQPQQIPQQHYQQIDPSYYQQGFPPGHGPLGQPHGNHLQRFGQQQQQPPQQHYQQPPQQLLHQHQHQQPVPSPLSHQQLPDAGRGQQARASLHEAGIGAPIAPHPQQVIQMSHEHKAAALAEDAKRAKRNHKIWLLSKDNGLMTPQDKNFITRIQLQQLMTATGGTEDKDSDANLSEDFYYQVITSIRGGPRQNPNQPLSHFAQTYLFQTGGRTGGNRRHGRAENHMQRMEQQVQRAVEAAKLKPKNKQLVLEGSLGKISFSNAKTPKPLLNIKRPESSDLGRGGASERLSGSDRKSILNNIEVVYSTLMKLEDEARREPFLPPRTEITEDFREEHGQWATVMEQIRDQLWLELKVKDEINPNSSVIHPFIAFLSYSKGKKAIPRIFRHLNQEQRVTMLTMIVIHLDILDVIRNGALALGESQLSADARERVELFSSTITPSLFGYVSEAELATVIGLLGLILDRVDVVHLARTKVGLSILTMLTSRATIVKELGEANDEEWTLWLEYYNKLFETLEPILNSIFSPNLNVDDVYVWQFLAAIGSGATPEQQRRLVMQVKARVMDTVQQSRTLPPDMASQRRANVNLFMRAIGLHVDMLEV